MTHLTRLILPTVAMLVATALALTATNAVGQQAAGQQAAEAATEPAEQVAPYQVPDGTPAELVEYIKGLLSQRPTAESRGKVIAALDEATRRILDGKPNDEQLKVAVDLQTMIFEREPERMKALIERLEQMKRPEFVRQVRRSMLNSELRSLFELPQAELAQKLRGMVDKIVAFIGNGPIDRQDIGLGMTAARVAQAVDANDLAVSTYSRMADLLAKSGDPKLVETAEMLRGTVRRLQLPGKPMTLSGTTLDGQPFNLDQLAGKLVLVDFWASWCGPCRASLPHLKDLYAAYRDRGFEIVGVSVDRSREDLDEFLKENPVPWVNLYGEQGPPDAVQEYGIMGVPTYILVGRDGKVISADARAQLDALLAERLGPVEQEPVEQEAAESQ